jgi:fructokinase
MPIRILAFGEILWDVFHDSMRLGGAPLNFTVHATRLGYQAVLASALGNDELGESAREAIQDLGIDSTFIRSSELFPTGAATVQLSADGRVGFRISRPAAYDDIRLTEQDFESLVAWGPDWLYYGTLSSMEEHSRTQLARLAGILPRATRFYDINLRQDSYTAELVAELASRAQVVKLNEDEMAALGEMLDLSSGGIEEFCRGASQRYGWKAVAVTLGDRGCGIWIDGAYAAAEGVPVTVADTVGAGDAFAAAFVHGLSLGWSPHQIGEFANRVGALIASRPGGTPAWTADELERLRM